jgi:NitT/TauT family transport system permease protein
VGFGFGAGATLGILLGAFMGLIPAVRITFFPLIGAIYPIPKIALFPLILLIMGFGEASKLVTVAASCTFMLSINVMTGVLNIPAVYKDVGNMFGASRIAFIRTVAIPAALPVVFAGLRLALGSSFLVVVGVEFIGAQQGIGWLIWHSWELFSIKLMFVGLLTVSALGLSFMLILGWVEKKLIPWHF